MPALQQMSAPSRIEPHEYTNYREATNHNDDCAIHRVPHTRASRSNMMVL